MDLHEIFHRSHEDVLLRGVVKNKTVIGARTGHPGVAVRSLNYIPVIHFNMHNSTLVNRTCQFGLVWHQPSPNSILRVGATRGCGPELALTCMAQSPACERTPPFLQLKYYFSAPIVLAQFIRSELQFRAFY